MTQRSLRKDSYTWCKKLDDCEILKTLSPHVTPYQLLLILNESQDI